MLYQPGLHILAEFTTQNIRYLTEHAPCRTLFDQLIHDLGLAKVGEVYHQFDGGGFTAVVCLTESHLSIHTWPEFGLATFDIFLSNYKRDNSEKVRHFYEMVLAFFEGKEVQLTEVNR